MPKSSPSPSTATGPAPTKGRPGDRAVRLTLPEPDHDRLRLMAARERTNMAELARRIVAEAVAADRAKNPG